jgi:hypothetical protein
MHKNPRLESKIRMEIQHWLNNRGTEFVICIKEFCQGNRAALSQVLEYVRELGTDVFVGGGNSLDNELLEKLEYGMFDLIGKFNSTPGGFALENAIEESIADYLTDIFAKAKKEWNLNQYKITASFEELDPCNCYIPSRFKSDSIGETGIHRYDRKHARNDARMFLDELISFAKTKLRGEKNREIAVNWLENPEKRKDYGWLASLTNSSTGSIKVTLTRLKHTLSKNYHLKYVDDKLVMCKADLMAKPNPN